MAQHAQELRDLIDKASEQTVLIRTVEIELGGRRVTLTLVTPDLLTLQDVLDETRAEAVEGESTSDLRGRYMRKLVPKIVYAQFDGARMEGEVVFPRGEKDPVYRRLMRHPSAFAPLTLAAADVVRPLQLPENAGGVTTVTAGGTGSVFGSSRDTNGGAARGGDSPEEDAIFAFNDTGREPAAPGDAFTNRRNG